MKNLRKVLVLMLLICTISMQFNMLFAATDEVITSTTNYCYFRDTQNNKNIYLGIIKYKENYVYCVDYSYNVHAGATPVKLDNEIVLSDKLNKVMLYGFPNATYQELNVTNDAEAYMATQFVIWEIAKKYDNREPSKSFDLSKVVANAQYAENANKVLASAKALLEKVENSKETTMSMTLNSDKVETKVVNDMFIAGPYAVNSTGTTVNEYTVKLSNANAYLTDANGNKLNAEKIKNNTEFYINWSTTEEGDTMTIEASANVEYKKVILCVTDTAGIQDFSLEVKDVKVLKSTGSLTWETLVTEEPEDEEIEDKEEETTEPEHKDEEVEDKEEETTEPEHKDEVVEDNKEETTEPEDTLPVTGGTSSNVIIIMCVVLLTIGGYLVVGKQH